MLALVDLGEDRKTDALAIVTSGHDKFTKTCLTQLMSGHDVTGEVRGPSGAVPHGERWLWLQERP